MLLATFVPPIILQIFMSEAGTSHYFYHISFGRTHSESVGHVIASSYRFCLSPLASSRLACIAPSELSSSVALGKWDSLKL